MTNDFNPYYERDLPTKSYKMILEKDRIFGQTDQLDAMRQVVFKIINTERYDYNKIYSDNYGIELKELFGRPMEWAIPELERRLIEALTWDQRILSVTDFSYEKDGRVLTVRFTVNTIFGSVTENALEVKV